MCFIFFRVYLLKYSSFRHFSVGKIEDNNVNSDTVHTLNTGTELLIDDALIASKRGVKRTLHPCVKHEVSVLKPDPNNPWGTRWS